MSNVILCDIDAGGARLSGPAAEFPTDVMGDVPEAWLGGTMRVAFGGRRVSFRAERVRQYSDLAAQRYRGADRYEDVPMWRLKTTRIECEGGTVPVGAWGVSDISQATEHAVQRIARPLLTTTPVYYPFIALGTDETRHTTRQFMATGRRYHRERAAWFCWARSARHVTTRQSVSEAIPAPMLRCQPAPSCTRAGWADQDMPGFEEAQALIRNTCNAAAEVAG